MRIAPPAPPRRRGAALATVTLALALAGGPAASGDEPLGERLFGNGSTLPGGDTAVSLDLGLDLPAPLLWGVRLDHGITDRWQLGIGGSWIGILAYAGGQTSVQLLDRGAHGLTVEVEGGFLRVESLFSADDRSFATVRPGLAYHWQPARSSAALFVKAGTLHLGSGSETEFSGAFGDETAEWLHVGRLTAGIEAQLTEHLVAGVQGSLWLPDPFGAGRVSLSYVF